MQSDAFYFTYIVNNKRKNGENLDCNNTQLLSWLQQNRKNNLTDLRKQQETNKRRYQIEKKCNKKKGKQV